MLKRLKRNSIFIFVVSAIVLLFSVSFLRTFDNSSVTEVEDEFNSFLIEQQDVEMVEVEVDKEIMVIDIKGAVNSPGVYEMKPGDRVINAIDKANGFHQEANKNMINLAALLEDEIVIFVPFMSDGNENYITQNISSSKDDGKININKASVDELQKIPGIGPAKAATIISNREENGSFKEVEDIVRVSGIGQKSFENMKEFIKVK